MDKYYIGTIRFNTAGHAFFSSEELTNDVFVYKLNTGKAFHLDKVKLKTQYFNGKLDGIVVEVLERHKTKFIGTVTGMDGFHLFKPDGNKISTNFYVKRDNSLDAKPNQKVVAEFVSWKDNKSMPEANIIKILGNAGEHETEIHSIIEEFGLDYNFPNEVELEAEAISDKISEEEITKRKDLRSITTIGIDPIGSRDADDTIGVEWVGEDCLVYINIADISFYVKPDSALDKEGIKRATSVYLVDRVVSLFPERLSNNICSLKSGSDKLAFTVMVKFDKNSNIIGRWFGRTVINVNKDYTYEDAQVVIENGPSVKDEETDRVILDLNRIAKVLRGKRNEAGMLSLNKAEPRFKLDENSNPIGIEFKIQKDSNQLIEEFMLLANQEVAKFIKSKGYPCVNRAHESPDMTKLTQLKDFVKVFGYDINIDDSDALKFSLNKLMEDCKGTTEENMITTLVTRTQQKAYYTSNNVGHWGLGFGDYSHFTSGIRRFSDVLCARILSQALGNNGYPIK